jgi:DNA-binding transcriptional LysR family regulator
MHNAHLGKLRIKSLQILLLAQELKSLRAVANAVSTSQPAVTQTLQELERTFGQTLLVRDHSGVTLTPAGEVLAARAKVALEEMSAAIASIQGTKVVPTLRLGVLPFLMYDLVPRTLRHLNDNGIPLRLQINETYVQDLRDRLFAGEDDLVLTRLSAIAVDAEQFDSIRIHRITTETVTPFVGERHPLYPLAKSRQAIDPALLADCDWVLPPDNTEVRRTVDELLLSSGLPPAIPSVEVRSLHSMMMIVGATKSVGAGPLSAVQRMTKLLKLAPLTLLKFKPPKTFTVAMYHARQDSNTLIPLFLDSVAASVDNSAPTTTRLRSKQY